MRQNVPAAWPSTSTMWLQPRAMSALAASAPGYGPVHCELLPDARMAAFAREYMRSISGMSARVDLRMVFILRIYEKKRPA